MTKDCVRQNNNAGKHHNACLRITDEYNEHGHLLHIEDVIGAYTRAKTQEEALKKLEGELISYDRWAGTDTADRYSIKNLKIETLKSNLHITYTPAAKQALKLRLQKRSFFQARCIQGNTMSFGH